MENIELSTWLTKQLTALDCRVREVEQVAVLAELGGDIQRALMHIREKCESAAVLVRSA